MTENKEHQAVTSGIFYCRDSAEINGCSSLQTLSGLESEVLRNRQQKHTAIRYGTLIKERLYWIIGIFENKI